MIQRTILALLLALLPIPVDAARYVVQVGDTLGAIAQRNHISVAALAQANGITNLNLVQIGRVLFIPSAARTAGPSWYRVRWGDTLSGLAARFGTTISTLRALNPRLGLYPIAGQWLRVCSSCGGVAPSVGGPVVAASGRVHVVAAGETLSGIASTLGVSPAALLAANHIANPDRIFTGEQLVIPAAPAVGTYDPYGARLLISRYAALYGIEPSLPLAVAWQESGFNQNMVSATGAVGVMQVEPYTMSHINNLLGLRLSLYNVDDNIHAGVYWLAVLVRYYGGDERMAAAAYYEGTRAIARHGLFTDTVQYVNNVMALKSTFGS